MAGKYQGFKNWNHWNVNLWIANDEQLYEKAMFVRSTSMKRNWGRYMLQSVGGRGTKTPDGAPYSVSALQAALENLGPVEAPGPRGSGGSSRRRRSRLARTDKAAAQALKETE